MNFAETMEIGKKIFTLNRVIWTLQGRKRNMEKFPEYIYSVASQGISLVHGQPLAYYMPVKENERWEYKNVAPRCLDKNKGGRMQDIFYRLEGWDTKTGWPLESTLKELGLKKAAEILEKEGKLPAPRDSDLTKL